MGSNRSRLPPIAALLALLGGCVAYQPKPVEPQTFAVDFTARTLTGERAHEAIRRWRPEHAEPWPPAAWDRADLLAVALELNPKLALRRAALVSAETHRRASGARPGPTLGLLTEYSSDADASSPWLLGLTLELPLDGGERRAARLRTAELESASAAFELAAATWSVRQQLVGALAAGELAARRAEVLRAIVADRDEQVRRLARRVELGESARLEVGRAEAESAAARQRLAETERDGASARAGIAAAIGVPIAALATLNPSWEAFDAPPRPPASELAAAAPAALLARADVGGAVTDYALAEQQLRLEVARQYPEIRLGPGYLWERGVVKLPFDLALALPTWKRNRGAIAEAEARREEVGRKLEVAVGGVLAEIDAAAAALAPALEALDRARGEQLGLARRLERDAERALAAGAVDRLATIDARLGRESAELAVVDALEQAAGATLTLEDALRRPLAGPELELRTSTDPSMPPGGPP